MNNREKILIDLSRKELYFIECNNSFAFYKNLGAIFVGNCIWVYDFDKEKVVFENTDFNNCVCFSTVLFVNENIIVCYTNYRLFILKIKENIFRSISLSVDLIKYLPMTINNTNFLVYHDIDFCLDRLRVFSFIEILDLENLKSVGKFEITHPAKTLKFSDTCNKLFVAYNDHEDGEWFDISKYNYKNNFRKIFNKVFYKDVLGLIEEYL